MTWLRLLRFCTANGENVVFSPRNRATNGSDVSAGAVAPRWVAALPHCVLICALLGFWVLMAPRSASGQAQPAAEDPLNAGVDDIFGDTGEGLAEGPAEPGQPLTLEERQQQYEVAGKLAEQLLGEQKWSEVLEQLNKMLELNPGDPFAYLGIGTCLSGLGAKQEAIESLSRAVLNPASAQNPAFLASAYIQRGDLYMQTGRYREAVDDLDQAVSLDNANPNAFFLLGKARLRLVASSPGAGRDESGQRDLGMALSSLNQAIRLREDFGEAYLERGRVLSLLRREDPSLEFAVADLQRAVQLMGKGTEASAELASTLIQRATMESSRPDGSSEQIVSDLRSAIAAMNDFLQKAPFGVKNRPGDTVDPLEGALNPSCYSVPRRSSAWRMKLPAIQGGMSCIRRPSGTVNSCSIATPSFCKRLRPASRSDSPGG